MLDTPCGRGHQPDLAPLCDRCRKLQPENRVWNRLGQTILCPACYLAERIERIPFLEARATRKEPLFPVFPGKGER